MAIKYFLNNLNQVFVFKINNCTFATPFYWGWNV